MSEKRKGHGPLQPARSPFAPRNMNLEAQYQAQSIEGNKPFAALAAPYRPSNTLTSHPLPPRPPTQPYQVQVQAPRPMPFYHHPPPTHHANPVMSYLQTLQAQFESARDERDELQMRFNNLDHLCEQYRRALAEQIHLKDVAEKRETVAWDVIKDLEDEIGHLRARSQVDQKVDEADKKKRKKAKIQGIVAEMMNDSPKMEEGEVGSSKVEKKVAKAEHASARDLPPAPTLDHISRAILHQYLNAAWPQHSLSANSIHRLGTWWSNMYTGVLLTSRARLLFWISIHEWWNTLLTGPDSPQDEARREVVINIRNRALTNLSKARKRQSSAGDGFSAEVGQGDWYDMNSKVYHDGQPQITTHQGKVVDAGDKAEMKAEVERGEGQSEGQSSCQGQGEEEGQVFEQEFDLGMEDHKVELAPFDSIDIEFPPIQTVNPSKLKE